MKKTEKIRPKGRRFLGESTTIHVQRHWAPAPQCPSFVKLLLDLSAVYLLMAIYDNNATPIFYMLCIYLLIFTNGMKFPITLTSISLLEFG